MVVLDRGSGTGYSEAIGLQKPLSSNALFQKAKNICSIRIHFKLPFRSRKVAYGRVPVSGTGFKSLTGNNPRKG